MSKNIFYSFSRRIDHIGQQGPGHLGKGDGASPESPERPGQHRQAGANLRRPGDRRTQARRRHCDAPPPLPHDYVLRLTKNY